MLTSTPAARAARRAGTASASLRWTMCALPPVTRAFSITSAIAASSAARGREARNPA